MGASEPLGNPGEDNKDAPLPSGGSKVGDAGKPVHLKDGGEGNMGDNANPNSPKDHTPSSNIDADHKAVNNPDEIK